MHLSDREIEFYKPLIALYLKYGSVDRVFASQYHNTGVSYPHFHRILNEWGIVKSAGPQSHLAEAVYFLTALAKEKLPLEALYKTMPPSLQISAVTLHRILSYIKKGLTRRHGTALLVSPESDQNLVLIGRDISTSRPEIGKPFGSYSLPMTYAKSDEPSHDSVLRTLQQEVAATLTINRKFSENLVPENPQVNLTIDIADVRVKAFRLIIPDDMMSKLDSFKLADLTFTPLEQVAEQANLDSHFRAGVPEIAQAYLQMKGKEIATPPHYGSLLNRALALLPVYS